MSSSEEDEEGSNENDSFVAKLCNGFSAAFVLRLLIYAGLFATCTAVVLALMFSIFRMINKLIEKRGNKRCVICYDITSIGLTPHGSETELFPPLNSRETNRQVILEIETRSAPDQVPEDQESFFSISGSKLIEKIPSLRPALIGGVLRSDVNTPSERLSPSSITRDTKAGKGPNGLNDIPE